MFRVSFKSPINTGFYHFPLASIISMRACTLSPSVVCDSLQPHGL